MSESGWPSEWLRGALTLLVLRTLVPGPTYGYAVASTLEEHGLGKVKGGTLYPIVYGQCLLDATIKRAGWLETYSPGKK